MSTNKLKPEQIKAFKEKEAEVFKADEGEWLEKYESFEDFGYDSS